MSLSPPPSSSKPPSLRVVCHPPLLAEGLVAGLQPSSFLPPHLFGSVSKVTAASASSPASLPPSSVVAVGRMEGRGLSGEMAPSPSPGSYDLPFLPGSFLPTLVCNLSSIPHLFVFPVLPTLRHPSVSSFSLKFTPPISLGLPCIFFSFVIFPFPEFLFLL